MTRGGGRLAAVALLCAHLPACAALGHVPPLHETETGLPGGAVEERWFFGLHEVRTWPDGSVERVQRPVAASLALPAIDGAGPGGADAPGPTRWTVLPPFVSGARNADRTQTTAWPFVFTTSAGTESERAKSTSDDDTLLAPFFAWGSEPGQEDYFAFFPFHGTLRQKLLAEEIRFTAFPLYATTKDDTWRSTHVLWPLVAWGSDPVNGREHFRVLPFWSQTDGPHRHSRTVAWPFVHWGENVRDDRSSSGWFVFPLGGRRASDDGQYEETSVLFPFFEWSDDTRSGDRYRALPWPFYRSIVRPGKSESTWYWPLHGYFRSDAEDSAFWLWPIGWTARYEDEARWSTRRFLVPLWMERESGPAVGAPTTATDAAGAPVRQHLPADHREIRAWPLFSWEQAPGGLETIRAPEIVPFFGWRSGESVYADLFALFRWRADREGRAAWDLPLGFLRWRRGADGASRLTFLWWLDIPTGKAAADAPPGDSR